ncbi:MAG: serine/threonine protein kinase [Acidobacteria bacterium]|nr:serine/threonine protein kinase [Acidobacteriota bacterium]MBV9929036.1 serine/threonine protein kinase [Acidobacteriota bacterium]
MIEPGTLLQNRYRVTRQIGRGGMGAVYVATDERFNSTVAVKQTFFFDDPSMRKAFEREAVLLNHLKHPALPRVSDHFVEEEGQFLVMEYVEGNDLGELLKARVGWFPVAEVLAWADELLDALEYLHAQEPPVVHRDIKPQNIKRTKQGRMVLLDFGLAKGTPTRATATATCSILGYSPHYAPLEQVQGTGTDPSSDIYSLGATLYHLLTGEAPVDALTRAAAVVNNEADPLRPAHVVQTHIPVAVSRVVRRALAQKAALRPKSAAEMRELLRQAAAAGAQTAPLAPALTRDQNSNVEATVVDSLTKAAGQSYYFGETTLNAARAGASPSYTTNLPTHFDAEPERRSFGATAKLLVAAAVVAICAAVAYPLLSASAPEVKPAPAAASATPDDESNEVAEPERSKAASPVAPASAAAAPTQAPAKTTDASESQNASGAGAASGAADESKKAAPTQNTSPIVIVVNPTPTPSDDASAESDEAARRAEDARRRQQAGPPPGGQPPQGYPPPGGPPPYGGPPPPPPGGYPPPPPRRPPL